MKMHIFFYHASVNSFVNSFGFDHTVNNLRFGIGAIRSFDVACVASIATIV